MPSANVLSMAAIAAGGAVGVGLAAHGYAQNRSDMDTSDRAGFSVMSAITGGIAIAGLALGAKAIGTKRLGSMASAFGKGAKSVGKVAGWKPSPNIRKALFGIGKGSRRAAAGLGMTALTVGALAYSSRGHNETAGYAHPDGAGGSMIDDQAPRGNSVRERMGLLGATGDMVFGLNNMRHG